MGSAIARSLQGKYRLLLMSRDEAKLFDLKSELSKSTPDPEVYAVSCAREAAWESDIIIIATPYEAEREVAEKIREVAVGKIVISISNPAHSQLVTSEDFSAAEELQRRLPYSKVVKTFNTTFAADFMTSLIDRRIVDAFIAGNNTDAVETVSKVVAFTGFGPVVAGDLTMSRALERMQLMLRKLALKNNYSPTSD
jgi:predicted dinucleotide-binding enzyme